MAISIRPSSPTASSNTCWCARAATNKHYGTVVIAEGLAELLPESDTESSTRDEHGHISLGKIDFGKHMARVVAKRYEQRTGRKKSSPACSSVTSRAAPRRTPST